MSRRAARTSGQDRGLRHEKADISTTRHRAWMMIDLDDPGYGIIRLSKRTLETLATMK
jgi:hypothetical protein